MHCFLVHRRALAFLSLLAAAALLGVGPKGPNRRSIAVAAWTGRHAGTRWPAARACRSGGGTAAEHGLGTPRSRGRRPLHSGRNKGRPVGHARGRWRWAEEWGFRR